MYKKIVPLIVALSIISPTHATNELSSSPTTLDVTGSTHNVPIGIQVEPARFEVEVPTCLPIYFLADGSCITATDTQVNNLSNKAIQVTDIAITARDGWTMIPYSNNPNTNQFGVLINEVPSTETGFEWANFKIEKEESIPITYDIKVPEFAEGIDYTEVADLSFIVDWYSPVYDVVAESTGDVRYDGKTIVSIDEPLQLQAVQTFALRTPTWESSNSEIATVDQTGLVTAVKPGAVTISYGDTDFEMMVYGTPIAASRSNVNMSSSNISIPSHYQDTSGNWYTITSIADNGFSNASMSSVIIPDTVTTLGISAFTACSNLTSVSLPKSLYSIGNAAFYHCKSLVDVNLPDSIKVLGDSVFNSCYKLTSITIPKSVETVGTYFVANCEALTTIKIYGSITVIPNQFADSCWKLCDVYIPKSVRSIGDSAFYNVDPSFTVYYAGSKEEWATISISGWYGHDNEINACTKKYNKTY